MPEDQKPFPKGVSGILLTPADSFLQNRNLKFEFINLITKKDDFLILGIDVHRGKTGQASFTDSPGETGGEKRSLYNKRNRIAENIRITTHEKQSKDTGIDSKKE
ncbi:MAG TPA: hypothetical protein EYG38_07175 [Verrucomicrobia bacterium]|nr:hypothetical protein [Verrucomicrobiota bacterium]